MALKDKLIRSLFEIEALGYGGFLLSSGQRSNYYCDIKKAMGDPAILLKMFQMLTLLVPDDATCIAVSGYGGIALGTLVSQRRKLPLTMVRDKARTHGTKKMIEGYVPTQGDLVCIIDDVFTTGGSTSKIKQKLLETQCRFTAPVVVVNRSQEKSVLSILTESDVKKQLEQTE